MTTTFDTVDEVYSRLKVFGVDTLITGSMLKYRRAKGSTKEDVVVNGLPINATQIQTSLVNVNVFVPNKAVNTAAGIDDGLPDFVRHAALTETIAEILREWYSNEASYGVEAQGFFQDEATGQWYSNFRVRINAINIRA